MAKSRTKRAAKPATARHTKKSGASRPHAPEVLEPELVEPEFRDEDAETVFHPEEEFRDEFESASSAIDPDKDVLSELEPLQSEDGPTTVIPEVVSPSSPSKSLAPTDPVALYLAEIRKYPLLTREQEYELAVRYRETGDPKAAEILVTSNLRFVVKIAAEYSRFGAKLIDLIQEGNVGLMHAVREFNPYKGVRLITYAVWWIRGYIQEYLMRQYSVVRIGTTQNQRKLFYRLQKEREALDSMGQEPTVALLAGRLGVSEEEVETMQKRLSGRDVSLNQPIDSEGNSVSSLLDFSPSEDEPVDEALGHLEEISVLRENIEKIRDTLNEKETFILEKRLLADEPMTLQEIGEHYGVTREAVRQLEARLIGKIRKAVAGSLGTAGGGEPSSS